MTVSSSFPIGLWMPPYIYIIATFQITLPFLRSTTTDVVAPRATAARASVDGASSEVPQAWTRPAVSSVTRRIGFGTKRYGEVMWRTGLTSGCFCSCFPFGSCSSSQPVPDFGTWKQMWWSDSSHTSYTMYHGLIRTEHHLSYHILYLGGHMIAGHLDPSRSLWVRHGFWFRLVQVL